MEYILVTHSLINIAITGIMAITVSRAIAATTAITHIRAITASTRITANTTNANREMYAITAIKSIQIMMIITANAVLIIAKLSSS